jgi:hypothetical protein
VLSVTLLALQAAAAPATAAHTDQCLIRHSRVSAATAAAAGSSSRAAEVGSVLAPGAGWLCAISDFVSTAGGSSTSNGSAH